MGYRVRIHVKLFPNVDFEYVFGDLTKNSKCLEHLLDLRASLSTFVLPSLKALVFFV